MPTLSAALDAYVAVARPGGTSRGVVAFFTGGTGTAWFSDQGTSNWDMLNGLVTGGLVGVQVRWASPWMSASPGEDAGLAAIACRPATMVEFARLDQAYGYFHRRGPCVRKDNAFAPRWIPDSIALGGRNFWYPATRLSFIFGDTDQFVAIGRAYEVAKAAGTTVTDQVVPNTGPTTYNTQEGRDAWASSILSVGT